MSKTNISLNGLLNRELGCAEGQLLLPCMEEERSPTNAPAKDQWYLSQYALGPNDIFRMRIYDSYSIHRVVYSLFEKTRPDGSQDSSGILHADLGKEMGMRRILILSDREPGKPEGGVLRTKVIPEDFLGHGAYRFVITVNPVSRNLETQRIMPVIGQENIERWFMEKASAHGFEVVPETIQTNRKTVDIFKKGSKQVTLAKATLGGVLKVTNKELFTNAALGGIGKGKAFGCGLLQITPV